VIPSNGATVSGTTTLDAAHTGSVAGVEYRLSGNGYTNVLLGSAANTVYGWIYSWNTLNTPNATYTLRSRTWDNVGHSAYSAPITINVANGRPPYIAPATPTVATFGDSIFVNAQDYLSWFYGERGYSTDHHVAGGTAPCDFFDQLATFPAPSVVVLSWVGNMLTPCTQVDRGTQYQVYSQDIDHAAAILAFRGIPTIWVGGPGPVWQTESQNWLLPIMQNVAAKYGQRYLNGAAVLEDSTHTYSSWLPCDSTDYANGDCYLGVVAIRDDTGHLAKSGARRYGYNIAYST
jgi:hypothetical protein